MITHIQFLTILHWFNRLLSTGKHLVDVAHVCCCARCSSEQSVAVVVVGGNNGNATTELSESHSEYTMNTTMKRQG